MGVAGLRQARADQSHGVAQLLQRAHAALGGRSTEAGPDFVMLAWTSPGDDGTTGTEFQTMYTTLLNWVNGYLGKSIAIVSRLAVTSRCEYCVEL